MKKAAKWLKSPWGVSIGTALFSFLLTVGYDVLKEKPILSTIVSIIDAVRLFIIRLMNYQLRVWWVLLGLLFVVIILYIITKAFSVKDSNSQVPSFMNYTTDNISGWDWSWDWEKGYDGKYGVVNLHPVCPKCSTPLIQERDYSSTAKCLRCDFTENRSVPNFEHITMLIYDNVKRSHKEATS